MSGATLAFTCLDPATRKMDQLSSADATTALAELRALSSLDLSHFGSDTPST